MDSVIIFAAVYLVYFVVAGLIIAWLPLERGRKLRFLATVALAGIVAFVLSRIAGHLYYDPRPFVAQHITPLIPHVPDNGFPSDHALFTMTLTAAAFCFNKKIAGGMLVLTITIGVARVLAHVHSPLDIAGGWVIGIIGGLAGYFVTRWLFNRFVKRSHDASSGEV